MSGERLVTGMSLRGSLTGDKRFKHVWAVTRCHHLASGKCRTTLKTVTDGVGGSDLQMEADVTWPEGVVCGDWEVVK